MDPVSRSIVADAIRRIDHARDTLTAPNLELVEYLGTIANDLQAALDRPAEWTDDGPWPELADPPTADRPDAH